MTRITIDQLPDGGALADADWLLIRRDGVSYKVAGSTLSGGSGGDAATLDGLDSAAFARAVHAHTIGDVTGLQTALDGKLATTGTAASATKLATARTINGVSFDGTANIIVADSTKASVGSVTPSAPGTAAAGTATTAARSDHVHPLQTSVSGNAGTATKLAAAVTINGVSFDGSAGITVADATKEPTITAGTTAQYWRGDKTWQDLAGGVRSAALTGLSTATNAVITATDTVLTAPGKLQAQITGHFGSGGAAHAAATTAAAGFMSSADKTKLDGIAAGAQVNTVTSVAGKTGAVTLAKSDVGLGSVDNTSDADKPVSTAQQTALNAKLDATANAVSASKLAAPVTINGVSFDGSASITVADSTKEPAFAAGTTAQYHRGDKTWQDLASAVRSAVMTGLTTAASTAVAATDNLLAAIGKLQAQVNGLASGKLDATANAASASKLETARTLSLAGDVTGSVSFDGSSNASITATVANDSHTHDTRYPILHGERSLAISAANWVTIAQCPGGRAYGEFIVYDTDSSKHNLVKIVATHAHGQSVVACLAGNRFSTRTIAHVRVLYNSADRTYGGAKLQIYCENPSFTLRVRPLLINQVNGWSGWPEANPVSEGTPTGWAQDDTTRFDDITNTATGFSGAFSGPGGMLTGLNASNLASGTVPDARLPARLAGGAGSGLDADTLDGLHASGFAQVAHTHDIVAAPASPDSAVRSGWYSVENIAGYPNNYGVLEVAVRSAQRIFQTFYHVSGGAAIAIDVRQSYGSPMAWTPWTRLATADSNVATATKLQTPRTINGTSFDGSVDITVEDNTKLPLAGGEMAGTLYSTAANGVVLRSASKALIQRNDGGAFYLLISDSNDAVWNSLRPLIINMSSGAMTVGAKLTATAPTTSSASITLPHGTTPTTLVNGDMWTTTAGVYARINGATRDLYHGGNLPDISQAEAEAGTATSRRAWSALRVRQATASYAYSKAEVDAIVSSPSSDSLEKLHAAALSF